MHSLDNPIKKTRAHIRMLSVIWPMKAQLLKLPVKKGVFEGPAKVYENEPEAIEAMMNKNQQGDVVIRYVGQRRSWYA